jgi:hypothetical protein
LLFLLSSFSYFFSFSHLHFSVSQFSFLSPFFFNYFSNSTFVSFFLGSKERQGRCDAMAGLGLDCIDGAAEGMTGTALLLGGAGSFLPSTLERDRRGGLGDAGRRGWWLEGGLGSTMALRPWAWRDSTGLFRWW